MKKQRDKVFSDTTWIDFMRKSSLRGKMVGTWTREEIGIQVIYI